jgi:hypothetical protein
VRPPRDLLSDAIRKQENYSMMATSLCARFSFRHALRLLGVASALLTLSALASQRAEALSPINPGSAAVSKAAANGLTIEVRGGHSSGGGGGGSGRSGGLGGSRGFSGAAVRGGTFGTGPAVVAGAPRFAGHGFVHRHRFREVFGGGVYYDDYPYDYPDYDYPADSPAVDPGFVAAPGCRMVVTAYGPRVVCYHRAARHAHARRRHHHRRHHRA